jgi:hypothetical protein
MNIKEAKEQIKNAITAYFCKDIYGEYEIPIEKQRPIFLIGPPGIGKTAIIEQIAQELGVGLVSYSMTHHTRQSALGLPVIENKTYAGGEYQVSEYTMSEIIASVFDTIEATGIQEGILFLDEINCVSETLAPSMLQFLQFKVFGRHSVPNGWIIVTAGTPSEYNNSVREFDIVIWDRMKRIDVEPEYQVWKEYAHKKGIHAAIITYLDIKKDNFYKIETTVDGKAFVTARGWGDLSDMIRLYERKFIKVDEKLVSQYLQNNKIAKDFSLYYDLYQKYKSDYQVEHILNGNIGDDVKNRAAAAKFDERIVLIGLMIDSIKLNLRSISDSEVVLTELRDMLRKTRMDGSHSKIDFADIINKQLASKISQGERLKKASTLSEEDLRRIYETRTALEEQLGLLKRSGITIGEEAYEILKENFNERKAELENKVAEAKKCLSNMFAFCQEVFNEGQEMLVLVTELTIGYYSAHFIGRYGCDEYFAHNKELMFYERQKEIIAEIGDLNLID